ncbi:MAG: glycosyltransferase family 2 protein [Paludibacteraceae bacterium]|nr:glycosyltransferase family 2 protein [Paludibacteraceae bacterium]
MDCRVSVCMATYNGEKYIRRQMETILRQLGDEDEVVISDDSSTDGTLSIIESFQDERIKVLKGNRFHSPIYNLENALKHAKGEFVFLADQDDIWLDDKVCDMLLLLRDYDLVVSDCKVVDADERVLQPSFFKLLNSGSGFVKNLMKNTYIGCCMAFKRDVLSYVLPFPSNIPMHDVWIALNVEYRRKKILFFDKPLILYRRHGDNASSCSEPSRRPLKDKFLDRWHLMTSIFKHSK